MSFLGVPSGLLASNSTVPTLLITAENVEELMPEIEANVYTPGV